MKTIFKTIIRELKEGAKNAGAVLRSQKSRNKK